MTLEPNGRTVVVPGSGLLEAVVGAVRRGLGGGSRSGGGADEPTTALDGRRKERRRARATDGLRTPEECIVEAIERTGGATRQSAIVEAVEWSESTVSRKLGDLESRGAVSRYQIGREKLVCLPGHEPTAVESSGVVADGD
jgi:hypothetical protein